MAVKDVKKIDLFFFIRRGSYALLTMKDEANATGRSASVLTLQNYRHLPSRSCRRGSVRALVRGHRPILSDMNANKFVPRKGIYIDESSINYVAQGVSAFFSHPISACPSRTLHRWQQVDNRALATRAHSAMD